MAEVRAYQIESKDPRHKIAVIRNVVAFSQTSKLLLFRTVNDGVIRRRTDTWRIIL